MTTDSKNVAWEIFSEALDLGAAERDAFLERACGDNEALLEEVRSLLNYSGDSRTFLTAEHARRPPPVSLPLPLPNVPERIGRYEIVRKIGEGGMGIVYEAVQENPKRRVALKIMRPGYFMPGMQRRFEFEAQVLGRLHHPGIAHVYEAGTVDLGNGLQPFFAMEFIHGQPITSWAADHALDTRQRLELVARVCDAAAHAHQKGVLHRDLKPDNVMVGEEGQPKILDFGVARPLENEGDGSAADTMTKVGQMIGTLAYMSPEQVRGDKRELDTRSDVYALGVICYQLLSGKLPHDTSGLSITESVETICNTDATRIGSLVPELRGDVEILVAKALEKDKEHRYQSAIGFAADIRRFLANEPILARAPSAIYQIRKFAKRHKGLVGGMVLAVVFLVAGVVAAVMLAIQADTQRGAAVDRAYRLAVRGAADALDKGRQATALTLLDEVEPEVRGWAWQHIHSRTQGWTLEIAPSVKLRGRLVFSPDSKGVLACLEDGSMGWWSTASGNLVRRLIVPDAKLATVARNFDPAGRYLAAGCEDGRVLLWDLAKPELGNPRILRGHGTRVVDLGWTDGGVLFTADPTSVWQWQDGRGTEVQTGVRGIRTMSPSPPGQRVAMVTGRYSTIIHDLVSGKRLGYATNKDLMDAAWSKDGRQLICATRFQNLHVLDATVFDRWTPEVKRLPRIDNDTGHDHWTMQLALSPDGKLLAGATDEGVVTIREAGSRILLGEYDRGKALAGIAYGPNGGQLACLDGDQSAITLWKLPLGGASFVVKHARTVHGVCWSPDSRLIACYSTDRLMHVYDAASGDLLVRLEQSCYPMFTGDSQHLSFHDCLSRRQLVLDLITGQRSEEPEFKKPAQRNRWLRDLGCQQSPAYKLRTQDRAWQRHVVMARNVVIIRDVSGSDISRLPWEGNLGLVAAWGPEERVLAVGGTGRVVRLYDTATWQVLGETGPNLHNDVVTGVDLSPDGRLLVTGCRDNMIRLFDVASQQLILEMPGHGSHIEGVVFSPDGSRIASGSGDATLRVWDTVPRHVRAREAREAAARREAERPWVERLMSELQDARQVAERLRADTSLTPQRRYAALRALMERCWQR